MDTRALSLAVSFTRRHDKPVEDRPAGQAVRHAHTARHLCLLHQRAGLPSGGCGAKAGSIEQVLRIPDVRRSTHTFSATTRGCSAVSISMSSTSEVKIVTRHPARMGEGRRAQQGVDGVLVAMEAGGLKESRCSLGNRLRDRLHTQAGQSPLEGNVVDPRMDNLDQYGSPGSNGHHDVRSARWPEGSAPRPRPAPLQWPVRRATRATSVGLRSRRAGPRYRIRPTGIRRNPCQ